MSLQSLKYRKRTLAPLGLSLLLLATVVAAPAGAAEGDKLEPARQFVLEVNGTPVSISVGKTIEVDTPGDKVKLKLAYKPVRTFYKHSLAFDYPSSYKFTADVSKPDSPSWNLEGEMSMIMLQREAGTVPASILTVMVTELIKQYGAKNVKETATTVNLGGKAFPARRLSIFIDGVTLVQEICTFTGGNSRFIMIIQGVPDVRGADSAETVTLKEMLRNSLRVVSAPQ